MPKQYCVGAVEKAIKILNFLAEHPDSSFSEIFTALELSKSTTYQTLSTLEMFHYVERLDNRQYRLARGSFRCYVVSLSRMTLWSVCAVP